MENLELRQELIMKWNLHLASGEKFHGDQGRFHEIPQFVSKGKTTFWLDIESPDSQIDELFADVFKCHPLAIEDCHNILVRPKIEKYPNNLFIVFRGINFNAGEEETDLINLYYFLGKNYILTVHHKPLRAIRDTMQDLEKSYEQFMNNPGKILYETLDLLVDNYFPTLEKLDNKITQIESRIFFKFNSQASNEIFQTKKQIMVLKRSIGPQYDLLNSLVTQKWSFIREENMLYYRDVRDHLERISDTLDMYRDLTVSLLDSYMTQISNRMNEVMKTLSIVATIVLPLSLLTGIFGMNFEVMPGLHWTWGFWGLMVGMSFIGIAMLIFFKFKKWL